MATNGMPEKQQQKTALILKASDEQMLQCGHYNAQLQHLIKKKGKDLLLQLVFTLSLPLSFPPPPFPFFSLFQRKFSARERPRGPSHWERVDTFNSP